MKTSPEVGELHRVLSQPPARITFNEVESAVADLSRSEKGRDALMALSVWMDGSGCSLDHVGQTAVKTLLTAVWGPFAGSARDAMREAINQSPQV